MIDVIKAIVLLIVGFIVLVKLADLFVDAISSIATRFHMSKMMIALTIGAFGTCAPELAISFNSISSGLGDIALANIIGSNVVNILLIIGIVALISPIKVKNSAIKKELPILLATTSVFALAMAIHHLDSKDLFILTRLDGFLFLVLFGVFIAYITSVIRKKETIFEKGEEKFNLPISIILVIVCCIGIIIGSDLVVENAKILAEIVGISTKIITMTVVVIGTSLPELIMTVVSAKKGEFDIALGNIIGTNIFNIGVVLGLPLLIYGGFSSPNFNLIDILAVLLAVILLYYFSKNDKTLSRKEGIIMLITFLIYYVYIFLTS